MFVDERFIVDGSVNGKTEVTFRGETKTLEEWSREIGIALVTLCERARNSTSPAKILRPRLPIRKRSPSWRKYQSTELGKGGTVNE